MFLSFTGVSHYSSLGASTVPQIVDSFKKKGERYITITEHGSVNSAVELYSEATKYSMKPIIGIKILLKNQWSRTRYEKVNNRFSEVNQNGFVTIHFIDQAAYDNFCKLTPELYSGAIKENGELKPVITLDQIKSLGNITLGSSGLDGIFGSLYKNQDIKTLMAVYKDLKKNFGTLYVEISPLPQTSTWFKPMLTRNGMKVIRSGRFFENENTSFSPNGDFQKGFNDLMIVLATKNKDVIVPSYDYHFLDQKQKIAQDAKLSKDGLALFRQFNSHHLRSKDELIHMFIEMGYEGSEINSWFDNLSAWATKFDNFKLKTSNDRWVLPVLEEDSLKWAMGIIKSKGRMKWDDPVWVERLEREIRTLKYNGKIDVIPYFKPIVELCDWCTEKGILFNLRGSAAGSLLIYLLGISGINPIEYDLSFERFINEGRIKANTLPDVDIDVGQRDDVIEFLKGIYNDKIMQLSVDVMSKLKTAIRDAERAFFGEVRPHIEAMASSLPNPPQGVDDDAYLFGIDSDEGHQPGLLETSSSLKEYKEDNPEVWNSTLQMMGILRNKGTHACSFVITDKPVTEYIPCYKVGDQLVTGFSPKSLETAGLIKYDFLGVNTLNDIGLCLKIIKDRHEKNIDINNLPDDLEVYRQFWEGNCETVFQFNTATVIPYLKKTRPKSIEELANITALCRPGTLDAPSGDGRTLAEVYVDRVSGEPIEYVHPDMEPILKNTYGVQLYQELQIKIFRDLAGYTTEEAETVRRGIGKKNEKVLSEAIGRLRKACVARGWDEKQVDLLAEQIFAAARYSFNKSHAVSYAKVGYACQYLKTKYPLEWWTAVLSNASKTEIPRFWEYCHAFVLLPDINKSGEGWQIDGNKIRAPINILNGVGEAAYRVIMDCKPYSNIEDFILKTKTHPNARAVNKGVVYKLIASGVMDSLFRESMPLQDKIEEYIIAKAKYEGKKKLDEFPEEYKNIENDLKKYLIVKELIPIWSRDIRKIVLPLMGCDTPKDSSLWIYNNRLFIDGTGLETIRKTYKKQFNATKMREGEDAAKKVIREMNYRMPPVTLAYVIEEKTKRYANKTRQMTNLLVDISGTFMEVILWPPYQPDDTPDEYRVFEAPTGFKNTVVEISWRYNHKKDIMTVAEIEKVNVAGVSWDN